MQNLRELNRPPGMDQSGSERDSNRGPGSTRSPSATPGIAQNSPRRRRWQTPLQNGQASGALCLRSALQLQLGPPGRLRRQCPGALSALVKCTHRSVRRGASLYARDSILVQVAWSPQPVERSWFPETKGVGHGDRILPWSVVFNEFTQAAPSSQLYCVQVMLVKFAPCALEGPLLSLRRHGAHLPTVTSPSCSQGGGAVFPGARGEDTLARRQQKMTLPVRRAEPS